MESRGRRFLFDASLLGHLLCKFERLEGSREGSGLPEPLKSKSLPLKVKHWAKPMVCPPKIDRSSSKALYVKNI